MPFDIGAPELLIIMVIVLIVFGAGKIPNVMKDLGAGIREFKKAQQEPDEPAIAAPHVAAASTTGTAAPAKTAALPAPPIEPSPRA